MQTDFLDAHDRHWQDAEHLYSAQRWANSDHLFGLAAECGLKELMLAFGMPFDANKGAPTRKQDRKHADGIWARYETYRTGNHAGASYGLPSPNPFRDWDVSQRYSNQSHFAQQRVDSHRTGARDVCKLVRNAQRDGLLA